MDKIKDEPYILGPRGGLQDKVTSKPPGVLSNFTRESAMSSSSSSSWSPFVSTLIPSSPSKTTPRTSLVITNSKSKSKPKPNNKNPTPLTLLKTSPQAPLQKFGLLLFQSGPLLASAWAPAALAVTGENGGDDLVTTLVSGGIVGFVYLFVVPPILMNWMRLRWYKRKFLEMYLQFMFTFIFFPGLLLWAPFVNFRKFPRDPTMEYPWSTPKDDVPLYKSR